MSPAHEPAGEADGGAPDAGGEALAPPPQEGLLGVMFFAAAGGLVLLLGAVAAIGYLFMR
ncbi:MAG TPA: hypothetical protein VGM56_28485 [Byssovorax sp.]|jgi:hypothetical protein